MHGREGLRKGLIALLVIVAFVIAVSLISVGSANPVQVYEYGGWISKVSVTLLALVGTALLMNLFFAYLIVRSVENISGIPAEDVICPGCGNPLLRFMGSHGIPIFCPNSECPQRVWHNGPMCYNKSMEQPRIGYPKYLCPNCRDKLNSDVDLFARLRG